MKLRKVDFIKVYNAINQQCGWIGETSTEVCGAIDIHPDAVLPHVTGDVNDDGEVGISDVTLLVNLIMDNSSNEFSDVNGDGETSVADITFLVNILLDQN